MRNISIWPGHSKINGFRIMNPPGFRTPSALKVRKARVDYNLRGIFSEPSLIDQVILDNVYLNIEIPFPGGVGNNWSAIGARMSKSKRGGGVVIQKLIINNLNVEIQGKAARSLGVEGKDHFDQMVFDNIDGAEGFPTKEIIGAIFMKAGLGKYVEEFLNPTDTIKDTLNPFDIFGASLLSD